MRVETGTVKTRLIVDDDLTLLGMAIAGVTVRPGAKLVMNGTVVGDVVVQAGAKVDLNGTVNGDLVNQGGAVNLRGVLRGRVRTESGTTNVHPNAVVTDR